MSENPNSRTYGPAIASAVVIANIVGTGVFTSLGYQLVDLKSGFIILLLWIVGGITALCGALSYAELGAALPRSGGEYHLLSRIYHPAVGFVSGWISLTIGFAAPVALAAMTFGRYLSAAFPILSPLWLSAGLVILSTAAHAGSRQRSSRFQGVFTSLKISLITGFCLACWALAEDPQPISFLPKTGDAGLLTSGAFAVALIYVNYAYTGWNSILYFVDEVDDAKRNLPRILVSSTAIVVALYVGLNASFLHVAPVSALEGQIEVGYIAATHVFGPRWATGITIAFALLLVSTVSAMTIAGPRVLQVMGEDYPAFRFLAARNQDCIPALAIVVQGALALLFVFSSSFESVLVLSGFTTGLNSLLTVFGVFVLQKRKLARVADHRAWLFSVAPVLFLSLTLWTLFHVVKERPVEAYWSMAVLCAGFGLYFLLRPTTQRATQ